ncbi:hypothetical protein D3C77_662420 [compost metagenome]
MVLVRDIPQQQAAGSLQQIRALARHRLTVDPEGDFANDRRAQAIVFQSKAVRPGLEVSTVPGRKMGRCHPPIVLFVHFYLPGTEAHGNAGDEDRRERRQGGQQR